MGTKRNAPQGRAMGQKVDCADDRANDLDTRLHYRQNPRFIQHKVNPEAYRRAVRCLFADAFVMSRDWPRRMRFSWVVDRNGCLRCIAADEGGAR